VTYSDFILLRDSLGDTNDQSDLIFYSLDHSIRCKRWRDVDYCSIGFGFFYSLVANHPRRRFEKRGYQALQLGFVERN
jgi:hypothetical protein